MAFDCFLKLDGIPGESPDAKHKDEIEILSFSFGATNSGTMHAGGGAGAGKVSFHDFSFVMRTDKATPKLLLACAQGQHIKSGTVTLRKASAGGQQEYLIIKLSDVLVSSHQTAAQSDDQPVESISLNFSKIEYEYRPFDVKGAPGAGVKMAWDIRASKAY